MGYSGTEIAIIGLAGHYPGSLDVHDFWRRLCRGDELVGRAAAGGAGAAGAPGSLDDLACFDAAFFGIGDDEARLLDPQHRHFLEVAWQALEDAGYAPRRVPGRVGIYAACGPNGYLRQNLVPSGRAATAGAKRLRQTNDRAALPARASHALGLRGPSVLVETADSSSLVAAHLACQALLDEECDLALVGGASLNVRGRAGDPLRGGDESPDGRCRPFAADAAGTVFGSGVGCVVLKRLADALADGDHVYALVVGTAVANDGAVKARFGGPSVEGVGALVREALGNAGVRAASIGLVEAHGAGVADDDAVELEGLARAFGALPPGGCALGSVKANVGHLDAAAGVTSLIKAARALGDGVLPPSLHAPARPAPALAGGPFFVPAAAARWPRGPEPRRAGVGSLGAHGTGAFVVLEEPPPAPAAPDDAEPRELVPLSAASAGALERLTERLAGRLAESPAPPLSDVAFTLQRGRDALAFRRFVVARDAADAARALGTPARRRDRRPGGRPALAFLLPGQGAQWPGMAAAAYRREPAFREELDACLERVRALTGLDLAPLLLGATGGEAAAEALRPTERAQPALFAASYAAARLLVRWGLCPEILLGHSVGEWVAACLSGVVSLGDALALVCERGRLMAEAEPGVMVAVALGEGELGPLLGPGLCLAAVNAPRACVVAGELPAIEALERRLADRGVRARRLETSHAFHSPSMEPAASAFERVVRAARLSPPALPFYSNVTGRRIEAAEATDPAYWARQLRAAVRFSDAAADLVRAPGRMAIEVGPGRALGAFVAQQPSRADGLVVASTLGGPADEGGGVGGLLEALGQAWLAGAEIDWTAVQARAPRRRVSLPPYPFERTRHWVEPAGDDAAATPAGGASGPGRPTDGGAPRAPAPAATPPPIAARNGPAPDVSTLAPARRDTSPLAPVRRDAPPLAPARRDAPLPLSFAQQRLWFLDRLAPGDPAYNLPLVLRLRGALDVAALGGALGDLVRRHEALRTTFHEAEGGPEQRVGAPATPPLPLVDLSPLPEAEREARALELAADEATRPFDLERGPLLRATLVRLAGREHWLLLTAHHIVCDGWSHGVMAHELGAAYRTRLAGASPDLPPLPLQYADYAAWQRAWLQGPALERLTTYWREALDGAPHLLALPTDRPRPARRSGRGASARVEVAREASAALGALARAEGATLFMAALAAFQLMVARLSGQRDLLIGSPSAGRAHPQTEALVGLFVDTLVLRARVDFDAPFRSLLAQAKRTCLGAYRHHALPFERLVEIVRPPRDAGVPPLVQAMFVLQNAPLPWPHLPGLELERIDLGARTAQVDLALVLTETPEGLRGSLEYDTDLFEPPTGARLAALFGALVEAVVASPDLPVGSLALVDAAERRQLEAWGRGPEPALAADRVDELVSVRAARAPDATAILYGAERWTYARLEGEATALARALRRLGAGPERVVGVLLESSPWLVVALLGVLKSGAAYLPLDPSHPPARLSSALEQAGVSAVITVRALASALPSTAPAALVLDEMPPSSETGPAPPPGCYPDQLAYVLFTSGSTGRPKGVLVPHRSLVNTALASARAHGVGPDARVLQFAPPGFDASIVEMASALISGACLVIAPREARAPGEPLRALLRAARVNVAVLTPSVLAPTDPEGLPDLATVVSVGEPCPPELVRRWGPGRRLLNAYGPTEAGVCAAITPGPVAAERPSVGRPWPHARLYVVDDRLELVPAGAVGELCVAGEGLARGYFGAAATAERFVPNPFARRPGERLYRTGDRARWLPSGELEIVGRLDHQVKVQGARVELGEIEAALRAEPSVAHAAALVREDAPGDRRLVAYVCAPPGRPAPEPDALRRALARRLPAYMRPAHLLVLDALPLTPGGKLDRSALPPPARPARSAGPPRTPTEELIAGAWAELLGVERPDRADDFFELGGHSLLAARVLARVRAAFGVELSPHDLFEAPALEAFARRVDAAVAAGAEPAPPPGPARRDGPLPLSFAQRRLWFLDRFEPGAVTYNVPAALRLEGQLDVEALERALAEIVRRHEALRTTFGERDGEPYQAPNGAPDARLRVVDLEGGGAAALARLAEDEAWRPFDLDRGPLVRATLARSNGLEHTLFWTAHHIVCDAWSIAVLTREVAALYGAFREGRPSPLAPLPLQYVDYAAWQRAWLAGEALERRLAYWRDRLEGAPVELALPADRPRPAGPTSRGAALPFALPPTLTEALRALGRREGATLFMVLLAGLKALLFRLTGEGDLCVATPIAGRDRPEFEGLVGFFVNTLVVRTRFDGGASFRALLGRVREASLGAHAHADLPFEKLVEALNPPRRPGRAPFAQVALSLQNTPPPALDLPGLRLTPLTVEARAAKFDLTLSLVETPGGLEGSLEYATDLFDAATVERMAGHLGALLAAAAADPDRRLDALPLEPAAGAEGATNAFATGAEAGPCLRTLFEAQAARTPGATALSFGGATTTYRELDERAGRLAERLRALGAGPEVRVGICLGRSADATVAIVAAIKAGAAYVPLDPDYPAERLTFMASDARLALVLTRRALADSMRGLGVPIALIDGPADAPGPARRGPAIAAEPAGRLAYVIYTSGSTGRPKGVAVEHRSVVGLVVGTDYVCIGPDDRIAHASSLSFDAATFEIWGALLNGARLVGIDREVALSPPALARALRGEGVSVAFLTTALFNRIVRDVPDAFASLRALLFGGEAVDPGAVRAALEAGPPRRLLHVYGPTEATTFATWHEVAAVPPGAATLPVGRAIAGARAHVLDAELAPVPPGIVGDLYVGGAGVARGYLGRPGLTAERFVPDPFSSQPGARLYQTGDRARRRADGAIEFVGRADGQVKVRGFRVELGEIEAALRAEPSVAHAAALVREDAPGDRRLVAYVCAPPGRPAPEPDALRRALARRLPAYMRPAHLLVLDALPLTPGGKLDRNALPPPGPAARRAPPVAPRTEVERALAAVWAQALGLPEVGVEDDFFELGGDSLLSMRLVSLGAQAGLTFTPKQVFQNPTVASLAAALGGERAGRGADQGPLEGPLPLTPNQHLSFEHDDPDRHIWNVSTLLALDARPDPAALAEAWRHVVSHHDALRVRSTPGPEGWRQHIAPPDETPAFARVDLAPLPDAELAAAIEAEASALQQSLDLTRGPLARLTYFDLGPGRGARLFALVHHTVCDGLSIEIVLEDLLTAFLQLSRGEPVRLPPKTTSLRALAERLVELARSGPVRAQAAHWLAEERRAVAPLPVDLPGGRNTGATARELDTALDAGETRALLALVSTADDVHVNDLLLAGLSGALAAFTGRRHALVEIEDHGRSIDGLDLSRTVGWLNYLYPVLLDAGEAATPRERLRLARAALRSVPDRGLGYGLLTYLVDDEALRAQVRALPRAQVLFNYRGNFDLRGSLLIDRAPAALGLRPAAEPTGLPHSLTTVRQHLFMVNAEVFGGRLRVQWTYSRDLYRPATVEALAGAYLAELRALAADP